MEQNVFCFDDDEDEEDDDDEEEDDDDDGDDDVQTIHQTTNIGDGRGLNCIES